MGCEVSGLVDAGGLFMLMTLEDADCEFRSCKGTEDIVFSVANAKEEIAMFANSVDASLVVIDGGPHQLSLSHPKEVASRLLEFVGKWRKGFDR